MAYSNEGGYSSVNRDDVYFRWFRIALVAGIGSISLLAAIPAVRDWAWHTFQPANYAAAHRKVAAQTERQATTKAEIDRVLLTMRQCDDGAIVYGEDPCRDGSKGRAMMSRPANR